MVILNKNTARSSHWPFTGRDLACIGYGSAIGKHQRLSGKEPAELACVVGCAEIINGESYQCNMD